MDVCLRKRKIGKDREKRKESEKKVDMTNAEKSWTGHTNF